MQLLEYVPNELTSELSSILTNEHFRQLVISHDLISSQIYQSPTLRLYPSGNSHLWMMITLYKGLGAGNSCGQFSKSSSGCTDFSSGSNEIASINQMANTSDNDNMRKIRFDKVIIVDIN